MYIQYVDELLYMYMYLYMYTVLLGSVHVVYIAMHTCMHMYMNIVQ